MIDRSDVRIHPTADVADSAQIGRGTRVWHQAQVREHARIGDECILGKGVFVDIGVQIGSRCKLQNGVSVFHGFDVEDGVFLGPGTMLLNDRHPRAITPEGGLKSDADWEVSQAVVKYGASVGGGAIVLPGVSIGRFALVAAGALVSRPVPDHGLVVGHPARLRGFVCSCAQPLVRDRAELESVVMRCAACGRETLVAATDYAQVGQA